ncbi:MAG: hypothetical protein HYT72_05275 [Candidatus Aenigmarchaeota archaeon]|nr:hypothetical protein [Candidatus Aenigmarchaeota archaeon]
MELVFQQLRKFGLSRNEAKAYTALLSLKEAKASEIAAASRIPRSKIYQTMQELHKKGFAEILPEKVTRFRAVDFELAVSYYIETRKKTIERLLKTKEKLAGYLNSVTLPKRKEVGEFTIFRAKRIIHKKIDELISKAGKTVVLAINSSDLRRLFYTARSSKAEIKVLCPITKENKNAVKQWMKFSDIRHYETETQVKIAIADNSDVCVFQTNAPMALCSRDEQFVALLNGFAFSAWANAPSAEERIAEIEKGEPVKKTEVIKGDEDIFESITDAMKNTKENLIACVTSYGLKTAVEKRKELLLNLKSRGVRVRYLVIVTKENLKYAKELNDVVELRHFEFPMRVVLTDTDCLLIAKDTKGKSPNELIRSNVPGLVGRMRELVENIWDAAIPAEEKIMEIETNKPVEGVKQVRGRENVFQFIKDYVQKSRHEIIITTTPNGILRMHKYFKQLFADAKKRGVKIRCLAPVTGGNAREAMDLGVEIRHIDDVHAVMGCFDNSRLVLLHIKDDSPGINSPEDFAILTNQKGTVELMRQMFDAIWEKSSDLKTRIRELHPGESVKVGIKAGKDALDLDNISMQKSEIP